MSKPPHPKYKVKEADTIESITNYFGIDSEKWLDYHNRMCRLEHVIRHSLPKELSEIYLLPELWNEVSILKSSSNNTNIDIKLLSQEEKTQLKLSSWVIYPTWRSLNHAYWFRYIIEEEKEITEIRYKILIQYIREESDDTVLLLLHRISDIYINDELPSLCMDELAYETGKVFYPLVIEVDKKANWVGIRNHKQIMNKWNNEIHPYVKLRYSSDITNRYLDQMDKVVSSKTELDNIFKEELLIKMLFGTIFRNYSPHYEGKTTTSFPVGKHTPILYKTHFKLEKALSYEGYKQIIHRGIGVDRSEADNDELVENNNTYSAIILLDKDTNNIHEAKAEWIMEEGKRKVTCILYPSRLPFDDKIDFSIDKKQQEKKGFFSIF